MLAAAFALNNRKDVVLEIVKDLTTNVRPIARWRGPMAATYAMKPIAEALMRMEDKAAAAGVVRRIGQRLSSGGWQHPKHGLGHALP